MDTGTCTDPNVMVILGQPCGMPRPRFGGGKGFKGTYYPKKYRMWRKGAYTQLAPWGHLFYDRPVIATVVAVFKAPKNKPKDPVHRAVWSRTQEYYYPCIPDLDNVVKAALDAIVHVGILADDRLVAHLIAEKRAAAEDVVQPQLRIRLRYLDD